MCFWDNWNRILKEIAVLECENGKSFRARSLRARSDNLFIDFLNVSVLSDTVVYSAIPYEKIKAYMFLRRSLASLARAYKLHVYDFFFMSVHLGACPPPPPIPKTWLRNCCQLSLTRRVAKWRWPIPSPHSLHEIAATIMMIYKSVCRY